MGIDTCIYVKTKDTQEPEIHGSLPPYCQMFFAADWAPEGATHEIDNPWRYWSYHYDRGPWPHIAAVLLELLAAPNVEKVWYCGDHEDTAEPFTLEMLNQFNSDYVEVRRCSNPRID